MNVFLMLSLVIYGMFWCVNYSEIFKDIRDWLFSLEWNEYAIKRLLSCSFCFSYHLSWMFFLITGEGAAAFILAFGGAILTYFWGLLEKYLLRNSI